MKETNQKLETAIDDVLSTDNADDRTLLVRQIGELIYKADDPGLCIDGALVGAYVTRRRPVEMKAAALDISGAPAASSPFGGDPLAAQWHALVKRMPKAERAHHAAHVLAYLYRFSIPLVQAAYDVIGGSFPYEPVDRSCVLPGERNEHDLSLIKAVDASFRAGPGSQEEKAAIDEIVERTSQAADKNKAVDAAAVAVFLTQDDWQSPRHERACNAWWWAASSFYVMNKPQALLLHIQHGKQVVYRPQNGIRPYMKWLHSRAVGDLVP